MAFRSCSSNVSTSLCSGVAKLLVAPVPASFEVVVGAVAS